MRIDSPVTPRPQPAPAQPESPASVAVPTAAPATAPVAAPVLASRFDPAGPSKLGKAQLGVAGALNPAMPWAGKPVPFNASTMFLLTDGRVMVEDEGKDNNGTKNWWTLTPDAKGNYATGTWKQIAPAQTDRLYYASAVLADGRVLALGGEYTGGQQTESTLGEIYDPVKNTWSPMKSPPGWSQVGDAASALLPDGRLLVGSISSSKTAIYDPKTDSWSDGGKKLGPDSDEESWALLPDGSVLTVDCNPRRANQAELWVPGQGWKDAGKVPVALVQSSSDEIGPATLLHDGRVLYVGATGNTALYTPSDKPGTPGTWAAGPAMPKDANGQPFVAKDAPSVLLPNGHVVIAAASLKGKPGDFGDTTQFFDFDPTTNTITATDAPPNAAQPPFEGRFMQLPSGETLFADGSPQVSFLPPGAMTPPSFRPTITGAPASAKAGSTIQVDGLRLNGMSQTVGYGDDAAAATNYPLVRLTDESSGNVFYARTHDHSTMGVATGDAPESTQATLPANLPPGNYKLQVVANGIPSDAVSISIG